ncbi:NADH:ubiquinone oxidoreductase [Geobacter sp. SVR]|uniref:NADH-quinone oxidoreductase subunit B family protein n=1 Tax=Geobacter sp. SVR TaxID=2495594 RepID=UPI00143EF9E4|nr:NADH:ubiquinone oxidoreductase [Geobacter sp. SVR]BCS55764.1 cytosolic NiFe-hydrogenase subunit delta [Geobacter sp. SVR]GCF83768.1 cytosolic NiFe-hydrogenase subunit delta [Geobacter sp. SVR]
MSKPAIAIAGLTACSGCQLTLLNCEEELLEIVRHFSIEYFPIGHTERTIAGPIDVAFVEGAVSTPEDLETLIRLRNCSRLLVAFGTCALWGGIAAMKNHESRRDLAAAVYGPAGDALKTFNPQPFHHFVKVDFAITGCPPEKGELVATLASLRRGTFPVFPSCPVCTECRIRENLCLLIERDEMCLGPLIQAGCNARCPTVGISCEGCRGPVVEANVAAQVELLLEKGFGRDEIVSRMQRFYPEWNYEQRS